MQSCLSVLADLDRRWESHWEGRAAGKGSVFLAACATSDITQPYHSLSYLSAALCTAGIESRVRDLGVEFWHYVMSPPVCVELSQRCLDRSEVDENHRVLLRFYAEHLSRRAAFSKKWQVLQSAESFFHLPTYLDAVESLSLLPWLLTLLTSAEYRTFSSASPPGYHSTYIDFSELTAQASLGFGIPALDLFYEHHANRIAAQQPAYVGLTVPFLAQVEHSFVLGARLRERGVRVVMGGPTIAKFVKYAEDPYVLGLLRPVCDWLVPGEGETAVVELAEALAQGRDLGHVTNLIDLTNPKFLDKVHFEQLDMLPSPDYSVWDWGLYAAPEPGALYSPTRGCYWNKCEFCDYGLAVDGPTSPWRIRSPDRVVADIQLASVHVRRFFFAVDVLSPSYANHLSEAFLKADVDVSWMADFRLETSFNVKNVALYRNAGCIGAAFGMESADQTTLDHICKGTDSRRLSDIVHAFASAGIPVQLMGFTGFPRETADEAAVTINAASKLLEEAATVALGRFGLSKGSLVAMNPGNHGIRITPVARPSSSIAWDIPWQVQGEEGDHLDNGDLMGDSLCLLRGFPYPFLGATSTHHSQLWFERVEKAPFPIPYWSYERLLGRQFRVLPAYERGVGSEGMALLLSRLCGRALEIEPGFADVLDRVLVCDGTVVNATGDLGPRTKQLLDFLMEHHLALFISEEEMVAGLNPVRKPRNRTQSSWHTVIPIHPE